MAPLSARRHRLELGRGTVWLTLRRLGVWDRTPSEKRAEQRFKRAKPNELWQINLIEKESTTMDDV